MRTSIKIVLLLTVGFLLFMAVVGYRKVKLAPPYPLEEQDYAEQVVSDAIGADWSSDDLGQLQRQYYVVRDLIMRFCADSLMDVESYSTKRHEKQLFEQYGWRVVSLYRNAVRQQYVSSSLRPLYPYAQELRELQSLGGVSLIDDSESSVKRGVDDLFSLRDRLARGWRTVSQGYDGLKAARRAIAAANELKKDEELANCTDLMKSVASLPDRLNRGHIDYLWSSVNRLAQFYRYNRNDAGASEYSALVELVNECLETYSANARAVYGKEYDLQRLANERDEYVERAENYFYDRRW